MPGGTLLTRLKVYNSPGPDGQRGGTPHMHLVCSELYFVLGGSGAVELLDHKGFSSVELSRHAALLFSSGTIHRLINLSGDLEILIVMQNSGLPERGDNIVTFRDELLEDRAAFAAAMHAANLVEAIKRRDAGVSGFLELKSAFGRSHQDGLRALDLFYKQGVRLTRPQQQDWYARVTHGAFEDGQESLHKIIELSAGRYDHLLLTGQEFLPAAECSQPGFCGELQRYIDPATLQLDGERF